MPVGEEAILNSIMDVPTPYGLRSCRRLLHPSQGRRLVFRHGERGCQELGAALIDRALVLNSNSAEAWNFGGWVKNFLGEPEAAIERFARAMRLSPLDPRVTVMRGGTAHSHFLMGRYDEAASWAAMALQDNPDYQAGLRIAAASNAMAGRPAQAHKAVARLRLLNPALRVSTLKDVVGPLSAENLSR